MQTSQEDIGSVPQTGGSTVAPGGSADLGLQKSLLNKKPKGRPRTPDVTSIDRADNDNLPLYAAITLLQRLIRGRAVQNSMFEGRYRRSELIAELRASSEYEQTVLENPEESQFLAESNWSDNMNKIKDTTLDTVSGTISSNFLVLLSQEKDREEVYNEMQEEANKAILDRKQRELIEAGRRQKQGVRNLKNPPKPTVPQPTATVPKKEPKKSPATVDFAQLIISAAADKVATTEVLNNIEQYPSIVDAFRGASSSEEQEQICRDLVMAVSSPRSDGKAEDINMELFNSVLSQLKKILG